MNWEEVSAIGQMLGSVAVFITLGYLAVQVRHARGEVRRSISQNRSEALRQLLLFYASDEHMCFIIEKVQGSITFAAIAALMKQPWGLTHEEAYRFHSMEMAWWQYRSQVIENVDELPQGHRTEFDVHLRNTYGILPGSRLWYETSKDRLNPDTVRYVDKLLAQPALTPSVSLS